MVDKIFGNCAVYTKCLEEAFALLTQEYCTTLFTPKNVCDKKVGVSGHVK